ncbi:TetR/AcrR family transcriptional regulator [Crossiella sp. CA198]|uniref:TetR/AcrR family transcriptional regulator n=1 Tax=Crossiella sp. CA198 TaxID=3455607 RepID=UPI003F8D1BDF
MSEPKSRRRGAELEQAILDAAWTELSETGYNRLTIEAVAARAGTSKPVIYRRWSNRAELVLAAWNRRLPARMDPLPADTGSLRGDLIKMFSEIARRIEGMLSEMLAGVMGETFRHPEITAVLRERLHDSPLAEVLTKILREAAARGELDPLELSPRLIQLPINLVRLEAIHGGEKITDDTVHALVDEVYLPLLRGLELTARETTS